MLAAECQRLLVVVGTVFPLVLAIGLVVATLIGGWSLFQISLVVNALWPIALFMPVWLAFLRSLLARGLTGDC